jgi:hypothetical protein
VFNENGDVAEGIYKDDFLFDGRWWQLNNIGSYDLYQYTKGKEKLKEKGV